MFLLAVAFVLPVVGIMKAILAKQWGWVVAIVVSSGLALGGVTTIIYLLSHRNRVKT